MKNDSIYLRHILEAIEKIERYLADVSYEAFIKNDMMVDAVVRELEIIGQAARNVSIKVKEQHPQIPWNKAIGMRNFLIHEYFGVNRKIIWETCKTDLSILKNLLLAIL